MAHFNVRSQEGAGDSPSKTDSKGRFREPPSAEKRQQVAARQQSGDSISQDKLVSAVQQLFHKFDKDGNGRVSMQELKDGLLSWGIKLSRENETLLRQIFQGADNATYPEFEEIMKFFLKLRQAFTKFDKDKSNTISNLELPALFQEFEYTFKAQVLKHILAFFDVDGSGELDWQEVVELMLYILYLQHLFNDEDKDKSGALEPAELQALLRALNFCVSVTETKVFLKSIDQKQRDALNFESFVQLLFEMKQNVNAIKKQAQEERAATRTKRTINDLGKRKLHEADKTTAEHEQFLKNVDKIREAAERSGKKFEDPDFPCNGDYQLPTNKGSASAIASWKRISDFGPEASLFKDGVDQGDVQQGALGDCWFLSALCVLAGQGTNVIKDLFVRCDPKAGLVVCRIFKNGKWHLVLVDDRIPCGQSGNPCFGSCRDHLELWVPLLEKAYAKIHGRFEAIEAGSITDGLVDLTGEASEILELKKTDEVWNKILENIKEGHLMGCAAHAAGASVEQETPLGILMLHAYGILKGVSTHGHKLVQVRNPWGHHEWKGRWSDGSKEWTPALMKELNVTFEDDGTFWMEFGDFCDNFNKLYVLRILTDDVGQTWLRKDFENEWQGESAGGCLNHSSWPKNPQYFVKSPADTRIFVSLRQSDLRMVLKTAPQYEAIGFVVLLKDGDDQQKKERITTRNDMVCMSPFFGGREVSLEFEAKAGVAYAVIPSRFDPGKEGKFWINIFSLNSNTEIHQLGASSGGHRPTPSSTPASSGSSSSPMSGSARTTLNPGAPPAPKPAVSSVGGKKFTLFGKWVKGKNAGGCPMQYSWKSSPQYIVEVSGTCKVEISVKQNKPDDGKFLHIGFFLFKAELPAKKRKINTRDLLFQSQLINTESVTNTLELETGTYNLVVCTYHPDLQNDYEVSVAGACFTNAGQQFYEISPDRDWKVVSVNGRWAHGTDGGCSNNNSTWMTNPKYLLTIHHTQLLKIVLEIVPDHAIGFYVFNTKDGRKTEDLNFVSPFVSGQNLGHVTTFKDIEMQAGRYIIMPATFDPHKHENFTLQVYANQSACTITPL